MKQMLTLTCAAFALLAAAALIRGLELWSVLGNSTVPWFCATVAIASLILAVTAVLAGGSPGTIPLPRALAVVIGSSLAVGVGMAVDGFSYRTPPDWTASVAEWAGFTVILTFLFWIPRSCKVEKTELQAGSDLKSRVPQL